MTDRFHTHDTLRLQGAIKVTLGNFAEPDDATLPILAHRAHIKPEAFRRHVGQGVRPTLENCLVDGLCLMQMLAPIRRRCACRGCGDAALDDVDGVNLQVRHRRRRGVGAGAEGFGGVQALGMQPAGLEGGELDGRILQWGLWCFWKLSIGSAGVSGKPKSV